MRLSLLFSTATLGATVAMLGASQAIAVDPQTNPNPANSSAIQNMPQHLGVQNNTEGTERALVIKSMPSKKIVGASVDNSKGERLGSVDDLVINLETGKVEYAALSVGGVLGIGDKLFAVPFDEFRTTHDTNNNISFVLDISKQRLENAPGFDKSHWPDFASPQWRTQIDTYYRQSSASRPANNQNSTENR